jgi:hypothetical protein
MGMNYRVLAVVITALGGGLPSLAFAASYQSDGCQLTVPSDWTPSKSRTARADKKMWASLMQAPTATEIVNVEKGLGAVLVSDTPGMTLMVSSASAAGMTNKQFHAITKTAPSCVADVTVPAGAEEAAAQAIAKTVSLKK